jgi:nuclear transport factor 2 (NTF2) superfamily protein
LKEGDALSPLLFNFSLEYAIRRVQKNQEGLKLNGTHQLLAYVNDSMVRENIDTKRKYAEDLLNASKEVDFMVNREIYAYVNVTLSEGKKKVWHKDSEQFLLRCGNVQVSWNNTNGLNNTHEEITSKINSGTTCFHSAESLLSSRLLSINVRIKICKTILVLYTVT